MSKIKTNQPASQPVSQPSTKHQLIVNGITTTLSLNIDDSVAINELLDFLYNIKQYRAAIDGEDVKLTAKDTLQVGEVLINANVVKQYLATAKHFFIGKFAPNLTLLEKKAINLVFKAGLNLNVPLINYTKKMDDTQAMAIFTYGVFCMQHIKTFELSILERLTQNFTAQLVDLVANYANIENVHFISPNNEK